jgi:hypothetical protein
MSQYGSSEVTMDDKLLSDLGYNIQLVQIIVLLNEEKKNRPSSDFMQFNPWHSM